MKNLLILFILVFSFSCGDSSDDQVVCTEEFRTVGITVTGATLDDFYTIRQSNEEIIRYDDEEVFENFYPVLTDAYQPTLKNNQETFQFIGIIGEQTVVDEELVIKADDCHILFVSGETEVAIGG